MPSSSAARSWRFYRAGGLDQVRFESGADIGALGDLDPKLWVALACPVKGLEFDERTLALIDLDNDGRVRQPEILAAVAFLKARLKSLDTILKDSDELVLDDLDAAKPDGQVALASARKILENLGKADAKAIAYADIADPVKFFAGTRFNGDGVITPESADDPATADVVKDVIATHGSVTDRNGNPGIDKPRAEAFFVEVKAIREWIDKATSDAAVQPFGKDTAAAFAAFSAVKAKVDDFFARVRLASFDVRALTAVNRVETDYLQAAAQDLTIDAKEMAGFPLARIEQGRALPLEEGLNPAWADAVAELRKSALKPAFGEMKSLSEAQWRELSARLAAHAAWAGGKPATKLDSLANDRIVGILESGAEGRILELIDRDAALAADTSGVDAVEKLVRLNRDFVRLLHNFVSFGDFYSRKRPATFQAGHLFLDSRECTLCLRVDDPGKHAALAGLSKCFLAYCDLSRKAGGEKMQMLAIFTQGDSDFLMVGRNGLFVDRKGQDWDATITKIVDAPISIRQAFFAPYKKFVRMVEEQVAKRAAAADAAADAKLASSAEKVAHVDTAVPAGPPAPGAPPAAAEAPKKIDLGTIALIGTAISGVAAMVGLVLEKFFGLGVYMPLGLLAIVLLISGPSMLIAALKLRQRSLGPILDASGWAINGRVRINIPFGVALTSIAKIPPGSNLSLSDPFEEKKSAWPTILLILALALGGGWIAHRMGWLAGVTAKIAPSAETAPAPAPASAPGS